MNIFLEGDMLHQCCKSRLSNFNTYGHNMGSETTLLCVRRYVTIYFTYFESNFWFAALKHLFYSYSYCVSNV